MRTPKEKQTSFMENFVPNSSGGPNLEQSCPPSSCGDLHNISDPFRLKDDPVGCGNPHFELSCVANQTILLIQNMKFYVKEINYTSEYLSVRCASTGKENAYVTPDLRVSDLRNSCRHVASVPVSLPFNRYQNLSSLAGVQRLLANGFNYMWSETCHVYDFPSDCAFQCSKNATRDYFVSMFRENQDSIDENLIPSLARNHRQLCHPSSCGDIRDIHHPFRLKGDPVGCGDPHFELSCVGNQAILLLQNISFYVKEINYTMNYLRIIDVSLANDKYYFVSMFSNGDKNQCYSGLSYSSSICKIFGIGLYFIDCLIGNYETYGSSFINDE
ncbi:putative receptor-like protein kinase [Acorus calamus]|uniref:Receptor-like protein kinase n=1 Tax=Acorus calamus TaxID=4465 RepID=A0AAV9DED8_ACOCL|nr:putative receptor-like protein kinase [Acorus calamus]